MTGRPLSFDPSDVKALELTSLTHITERDRGQQNISPTTLHMVDFPVPGLPTTSREGNIPV